MKQGDALGITAFGFAKFHLPVSLSTHEKNFSHAAMASMCLIERQCANPSKRPSRSLNRGRDTSKRGKKRWPLAPKLIPSGRIPHMQAMHPALDE
jgi:hypothetical protein